MPKFLSVLTTYTLLIEKAIPPNQSLITSHFLQKPKPELVSTNEQPEDKQEELNVPLTPQYEDDPFEQEMSIPASGSSSAHESSLFRIPDQRYLQSSEYGVAESSTSSSHRVPPLWNPQHSTQMWPDMISTSSITNEEEAISGSFTRESSTGKNY